LPSDPIERIRERFPDTGVAWLRLETQGVAITQLHSGELRAGAIKAQRPRAGTRVGGAKRRALHGAEHSSTLGCVMAARTTAEAKRGLLHLDDGDIRFQDEASEPRDTYVTGGRRERRRWTPQAADNLPDGQWGVSDPRVSALGRSRRAKGEGRSRPSSLR
jgi:hypothetical protein